MFVEWMARRPDDEGAGGAGAKTDDGTADDVGSLVDIGIKDDAGDGDAGQKDDKTQAAYRPEGLADNLIGATDQETIDKLADAFKGLQKASSRKGVPDDLAAYKIDVTGDDDMIGHGLTSDRMAPVVDRARAAAKEAGLGVDQFDKFVRSFAGADGDIEWMLPDDEAARLSGEREFKALAEDLGGVKRAQALAGHLATHWNQWVANGTFTGEFGKKTDGTTDLDEFRAMIGTARGAKIMGKIISMYTQKDPIPLIDADSTPSPQALQQEIAAVMDMPPGPERDAAYAEVEKKFAQRRGVA